MDKKKARRKKRGATLLGNNGIGVEGRSSGINSGVGVGGRSSGKAEMDGLPSRVAPLPRGPSNPPPDAEILAAADTPPYKSAQVEISGIGYPSYFPAPPPPPPPVPDPYHDGYIAALEQQRQQAASRAVEVAAADDEDPFKAWKAVELTECIGQGSFGSVYRATGPGGEAVAVKLITYIDADDRLSVAQEVKLLRGCKHPNVVRYFAAFEREHALRLTLFVIMELASNGSALDLVHECGGRVGEAAVAWVCAGALAGLDYLHTERKTIHRDIKAANILLTSDASVKLADLGLAAQLTNTMSQRGTLCGTPSHMAPELVRPFASPDDSTHNNRADIWSLGITAVELAIGRTPHSDAQNVVALAMRVWTQPPPTLDATAASDALRDFLAKALVKEPISRPPAADLMRHPFVAGARADALRAFLRRRSVGRSWNADTTARV